MKIPKHWIEQAKSAQFHQPMWRGLKTESDFEALYRKYLGIFQAHGYQVRYRDGGELAKVSGVRPWRKILFLRQDFRWLRPFDKCVLLAHEHVHLLQMLEYGPTRFLLKYARPGFAWSAECQAYGLAIKFRKEFPDRHPLGYIPREIDAAVASLHGHYAHLKIFSDLSDRTREVLSAIV